MCTPQHAASCHDVPAPPPRKALCTPGRERARGLVAGTEGITDDSTAAAPRCILRRGHGIEREASHGAVRRSRRVDDHNWPLMVRLRFPRALTRARGYECPGPSRASAPCCKCAAGRYSAHATLEPRKRAVWRNRLRASAIERRTPTFVVARSTCAPPARHLRAPPCAAARAPIALRMRAKLVRGALQETRTAWPGRQRARPARDLATTRSLKIANSGEASRNLQSRTASRCASVGL